MKNEEIIRRELPRYADSKIKIQLSKEGVKQVDINFTFSSNYITGGDSIVEVKPILKRLTKEVLRDVFKEFNPALDQSNVKQFSVQFNNILMGGDFFCRIDQEYMFPKFLLDALYEKGVNICIPDELVIYED